MTTRQNVLAVARTWVGTPYRHQGRHKHVGADCVGFLAGVAIESGLYPDTLWDSPEIRPFIGYGREPSAQLLRQALELFLDPIPLADVQPADVYLMRFNVEPQHVALVASETTILHSFAIARKVSEHTLDETWRARICGAYRMRGLA